MKRYYFKNNDEIVAMVKLSRDDTVRGGMDSNRILS